MKKCTWKNRTNLFSNPIIIFKTQVIYVTLSIIISFSYYVLDNLRMYENISTILKPRYTFIAYLN